MKRFSRFLLMISICCLAFPGTAQKQLASDSVHQWMFGGFSALAYKGDLGSAYSKWSAAFYGGLQFNTHKRFSGCLNLIAGKVGGQDVTPTFNLEPGSDRLPNTYFSTLAVSVYYQLLFNIYAGKRLKIFAGQGVGLIRYTPKNEAGIALATLNITRAPNENYGSLTVLAPSSAGLSWKFSNRFGISYRLSLLNTATDYLDNISQLGMKPGGDNVLSHHFSLMVPVQL